VNTPNEKCPGNGLTDCVSYIDGRWRDRRPGSLVELRNPANLDEVVSVSCHAARDDASSAMRVAAASFPTWKSVPLSARIDSVKRLRERLERSRDRLATAIHCETGKTFREARQEVAATLQELNVQLQVFGHVTDTALSSHRVVYEPLGPVLLVTPSNFPLAALLRKLVPALLSGNTIVAKASELTPVTASLVFELIDQLDIPDGVANLVIADGRSIMDELVAAPELRAVSLTGSNAAGESIAALIGARNVRYQAELGGSNVAVVFADAHIETAVDAIVEHGFACAGQWCTGTTRVVIDERVFDPVSEALVRRAESLQVGCDADMGAMISETHLKQVRIAVEALLDAGARELTSSRTDDFGTPGYFFAPVILEAPPGTRIGEIFGPVLVLLRAEDNTNALRIANDSSYGLSFSVFTTDQGAAEEAVAAADAGLCHVNLGTGFRDSELPLSGWKWSGRGTPESGTWARDFFTQTKAIYMGR